jgi:hypothetical protein
VCWCATALCADIHHRMNLSARRKELRKFPLSPQNDLSHNSLSTLPNNSLFIRMKERCYWQPNHPFHRSCVRVWLVAAITVIYFYKKISIHSLTSVHHRSHAHIIFFNEYFMNRLFSTTRTFRQRIIFGTEQAGEREKIIWSSSE